MAENNFETCLSAVLRYEGGRVDDARDPGGRTNQGVTQRTYDAYRRSRALFPMDVYKMAIPERNAIYRQQYWNVIGGDGLPAGVDLVIFDAAVNSGVANAKAWDWKARGLVPLKFIDVFCDERLAFLKHLSTWAVYGKGWSSRVADVRARAKVMVSQAHA